VIYQSDIERTFAEQLEKNEAIKVYAKLPGWFRVPTPLGPYNPDWAVLFEKDGGERLYLVVETKGSLSADDRRAPENAKIECGEAHFEALHVGESPPVYKVATSLDDLLLHLDAKS
jgi:type III restriction enzyme